MTHSPQFLSDAPNPLTSPAAAQRFLASYWQKQPGLIRQALAVGPYSPGTPALREMATHEAVESRLVRRRGARWRLVDGPIAAAELPGARDKAWTLLIQGVDLHLDAVADLRERFRFMPDVRLDDVMISVAGDQGGVGPHVDSYDVFLLQLEGRRRWHLAPPADYLLQPGQPLRLLAHFKAAVTVDLDAGDMLYLPPGWAHDGIAQGPCTTASIGLRAPSDDELLLAWLRDSIDAIARATDEAADDNETLATEPVERYLDDTAPAELRRWQRQPAAIPAPMARTLRGWLQRFRPGADDINDFIGRYLTEPKAGLAFDGCTAARARRLLEQARRHGLRLDRRTRMAYRADQVFINGDSFVTDGQTRKLLAQLANARRLNAADTAALFEDPDVAPVIAEWAQAGWIRVET
ncbi:MAG: cupin domain-containing protein [Burkholderiaceae bacterium]